MPLTGALFNAYFDEYFAAIATPGKGLALVNYLPSYSNVCRVGARYFTEFLARFDRPLGRGVLHVVEQRTQGGRDYGIQV
ncbi:hypothetical protein HVA01_31960 [Halovibrio variabilis]|uniref:Uncharacterized protein n=1 Tax=Halovibrio variabilis TaxID=31910 RepID=A0A511USH9_9GAMM|nr:hypothetical protein HVA01_31960 [Halovibrio variabilis]